MKLFSKENLWRSLRLPVIALALILVILYLGGQKNFGAVQYAQFILDGLRGGAIYAMIAMGFVIVYNVTGVINFAQGAFVMLGAMLAVTFYEIEMPLPIALRLIISVILSIGVTTIIGLLVERLTIHPARFSSPLTLIIITVGVFISLQGIALLVWGPDAHIYPSFTTLGMADKIFRVNGVVIKAQGFWIWGITALVLILLAFFFEKTLLGKAMRACAINQRAARLEDFSVSMRVRDTDDPHGDESAVLRYKVHADSRRQVGDCFDKLSTALCILAPTFDVGGGSQAWITPLERDSYQRRGFANHRTARDGRIFRFDARARR